MTPETRYRRLLRWYPRSWRDRDGEVLLGTLLDAAEAEGRSGPTSSEARMLRLTGIGERFTMRAGFIATIVALAVSALFGATALAQIDGAWLPWFATVFLSPTLLTFGVLALLRHARRLLPVRTVLVFALATSAWGLAFLSTLSWSVGFDEADAGGTPSLLARAFLPLFFTGWAIGGCTILVLILALMPTAPAAGRWVGGVSAALIAPPALGTATVTPLIGGFVALALLFLIVRTGLSRGNVAVAHPTRSIAPSTRRRVAILASAGLLVSLVSLAFALTGSAWVAGIDGTRAMQLGLAGGQLAAIPLLTCVGWIGGARRPHQAASLWAGVLTVSVGLVVFAIYGATGLSATGDTPWLPLILTAAGLGLLLYHALRLPGGIRVLLAVAAAAVVVVPLWGLSAVIGFVVPIVAVPLMVWGLRRTGTPSSAPVLRAS